MDADLTLSGRLVRCPLLYVWRRDGQALYVGLSRSGLGRPCFAGHSILKDILPTDTVEIHLYPDLEEDDYTELHKQERLLIDALDPPLNRHKKHTRKKPYSTPLEP